ncbi:MAG: hypothetical protein ACYS47_12550 [Planctomycetota bacterium]|jgi:hypothetical protein
MRIRALSITAVLLLLAAGCSPRGGRSTRDSHDDFAKSVREIERLRAENRQLRKEIRDSSRNIEKLRAAVEGSSQSSSPISEETAERIADLEARVTALQARLAEVESGGTSAERDTPGPDDIARLFIEGVRRRDRKAVESVVDWRGLLEAVLREGARTPEEADRALEDFRELSPEAQKIQIEETREEFLDLVFGPRGPNFTPTRLWAKGDPEALRYRVADDTQGGSWNILLNRSGGSWKVTGVVREAPVPSSGQAEIPGTEGEGERGR